MKRSDRSLSATCEPRSRQVFSPELRPRSATFHQLQDEARLPWASNGSGMAKESARFFFFFCFSTAGFRDTSGNLSIRMGCWSFRGKLQWVATIHISLRRRIVAFVNSLTLVRFIIYRICIRKICLCTLDAFDETDADDNNNLGTDSIIKVQVYFSSLDTYNRSGI